MSTNQNTDIENPTVEESKGQEVISMTQDELDDLIERRLARQKRTLTEKYEEQIKELKEDMSKSTEGISGSVEITQELERTNELAAEKSRLEMELIELRKTRLEDVKKTVVTGVARELGAIAPEDVFSLVAASIQFTDENEGIPVTTTGSPMLDESGSTMTIEAYVARFLKSRPYLVASSSRGDGAGSGIGGGSADSRRDGSSVLFGSRTQEIIRKGLSRDRHIEEQGRFWHGGPDLG